MLTVISSFDRTEEQNISFLFLMTVEEVDFPVLQLGMTTNGTGELCVFSKPMNNLLTSFHRTEPASKQKHDDFSSLIALEYLITPRGH